MESAVQDIESRRCMRCGRVHRTGLSVVRPLCPPCWIRRDAVKHPERQLPAMFRANTTMEQLVEDWCQYAELIASCVDRTGGRVNRKKAFGALTPIEQELYALTQFDTMVREQCFFGYFCGFRPLHQSFIEPGLRMLEAYEHLEIYKEAEALFEGLSVEEMSDMREEIEFPENGHELEFVTMRYFDTEDLAEKLAVAAWNAGLITERRARAVH